MFRRKIQKQFSISKCKTVLFALSFALFSMVHGVLFMATPAHAMASTGHHPTSTTTSTSCIQQCTIVASDTKLTSVEEEEEDPQLLTVLSITIATGLFVVLKPHLRFFTKRKLRIPIYKQVACYRI